MWSVFGRRKLESLVKFLILILKVAIDATGPPKLTDRQSFDRDENRKQQTQQIPE
jgi:hypothetical protein